MKNELVDIRIILKNNIIKIQGNSIIGSLASTINDETKCGCFVKIKNSNEEMVKTKTHGKKSFFIFSEYYPWMDSLENFCVVRNYDESKKIAADEVYSCDLSNKKIIGITGTNGKTTTVDLILQILKKNKINAISIGTLGVRNGTETLLDFSMTTPDYIEFKKIISRFGDKAQVVVMEISSHALEQNRLLDLKIDMAGWTSFSQDHLDYHGNLEEYFKAKTLIVKNLKASGNLFVPPGQKNLINLLNKSNISFNASVDNVLLNVGDSEFLNVEYNKDNLSVAYSIVAKLFGILDFNLSYLDSPPGRLWIKKFKTNYIAVDFAHTPDALENVIKALKTTYPGKKLWVLFGCGGDRDKTKRPMMGKISESCEKIFVTSDNPRSEEPIDIINNIISGIDDKSKVSFNVDRRTMAQLALKQINSDTVLLFAGKGHETTIQYKNFIQDYSDILTVEKFLEENKND
jgi:UDP-N-acetylmuramoyl-L-alanyl-D-glutamate--2,6-diaminopimelate ligase